MKTILVTGHAGFIGSNLVHRLFSEMTSGTIVGIDNLNDYYDPSLKSYRLDELDKAKPSNINYKSIRGNIADKELIDKLFAEYKFDIVVNLAAQAGVRYSIENPMCILRATSLVSTTSLKPAATTLLNTWCTPAPARCMAATRKCRSLPTTVWTILSACMRPQRRVMS